NDSVAFSQWSPNKNRLADLQTENIHGPATIGRQFHKSVGVAIPKRFSGLDITEGSMRRQAPSSNFQPNIRLKRIGSQSRYRITERIDVNHFGQLSRPVPANQTVHIDGMCSRGFTSSNAHRKRRENIATMKTRCSRSRYRQLIGL